MYKCLLIAKAFLKHNINIFIHIFFIQLFLSLFASYWPEQRFSHHNKIRTNPINQYLSLQLSFLNQVSQKSPSESNTSTFRGCKFQTRPIQNDQHI